MTTVPGSTDPSSAAAQAPPWLAGLAERMRELREDAVPGPLRDRVPAPGGAAPRPASVLMLFGERAVDAETGAAAALSAPAGDAPPADVLLLQRSADLRHHGGQVAFPGGAADPGDGGPVGTALREAQEETGLDPAGVSPLLVMPELYIPPSGFSVSPVLAYWRRPSPVRAVDQGETARVARIPLADLIDPVNRFQVGMAGQYKGPAFMVDGMLVWGFTAGLLSTLIGAAGWEQPWDEEDVRELSTTLASLDEQAGSR